MDGSWYSLHTQMRMGPIYSTSNYWQPPKCQPLGKKVEIKVQKLNTQIHNFDVCTYSSLQKGRFCIFSFSRFHVSLRCHERAGHDSATKQEVKLLSRVRVFATPWTVACQSPPSMGFFQALIMAWATISFSRGSSQSRDRTRVSHIAGRLFTIWATREVSVVESKDFQGGAKSRGTAAVFKGGWSW